MTSVDIQKKWEMFKHRVRLFNHVPFAEFVIAAGSMATGNIKPTSDFDVIVGARSGRIYTVRFFSVLFLGIRGWRRGKDDGKDDGKSADKICLNHFVTKKSYKLSGPYNEYWNTLYQNLVPMLGSLEDVQAFFDANDWMEPMREYVRSPFHEDLKPSKLRVFIENRLRGPFGDYIEAKLKDLQVKKIKESIKKADLYKPRIIYNDFEMEFHPNTLRIEKYLEDN